jgi:hypothetical protein
MDEIANFFSHILPNEYSSQGSYKNVVSMIVQKEVADVRQEFIILRINQNDYISNVFIPFLDKLI